MLYSYESILLHDTEELPQVIMTVPIVSPVLSAVIFNTSLSDHTPLLGVE